MQALIRARTRRWLLILRIEEIAYASDDTEDRKREGSTGEYPKFKPGYLGMIVEN